MIHSTLIATCFISQLGDLRGFLSRSFPQSYRTVDKDPLYEPVIQHLSVTQNARQRKRYAKAWRQLLFAGGVTVLFVLGWCVSLIYDTDQLWWLSLSGFIAGGITLTRFFALRRKQAREDVIVVSSDRVGECSMSDIMEQSRG